MRIRASPLSRAPQSSSPSPYPFSAAATSLSLHIALPDPTPRKDPRQSHDLGGGSNAYPVIVLSGEMIHQGHLRFKFRCLIIQPLIVLPLLSQ